jgi:hypothetical protein
LLGPAEGQRLSPKHLFPTRRWDWTTAQHGEHFDSANLATILEIGPHLESTQNGLLCDVPARAQPVSTPKRN